MDVLKEFDINSYTDGAYNVSVTVPNMDKYKIFAIGSREGLSGVGNDYSFGSSFSMIPRSIFTDKSSQINKLTLQFSWYPDYKYNFQLKYENSTTVKVAYKSQGGSQLANFYAIFYGIKI